MTEAIRQLLMFRYLFLHRRAKKKDAAEPEDSFPPLEVLMDQLWEKNPTVGQRHMPALKHGPHGLEVEKGTRYVVAMSRRVHQKSKAVLVRFCVFTGGEVPAFAPKDLEKTEAQLNYTEVKDEDQRSLEPAMEFSALMLGRVVLVQNRQGASAAASVKGFIYRLGRKLNEATMTTPEFLHVTPVDLASKIEEAGGVKAVSFALVEGVQQDGHGIPLNSVAQLEDRLGADKARIRLSASGKGTLDLVESLNLFEDPDDDGVEGVHLHLKNGETITGLELKMCKQISVKLKHGVPDPEAVDAELLGYLQELIAVKDGKQAVTPDGKIGALLKITSFKVK